VPHVDAEAVGQRRRPDLFPGEPGRPGRRYDGVQGGARSDLVPAVGVVSPGEEVQLSMAVFGQMFEDRKSVV
jgi:hypothetical protein